jgi:multiple sugar transport system ATP-binding protein
MSELQLKKLKKRFGKVQVLSNISLEVRDGEFMTFLGPSGCGKTTTLNIIAGLEHADEGEIYIGGRLVNHLSPRERNIAMAFQNYALYPHKNVYENLAFPLRARGRGFSKDQIDKRVREVASVLDIDKLLNRFPRELSGGQQQRVSIGRSLVRNPTLFLMDEPLSNLDARLRLRMRAELKDLHARMKSTIVYVTHDQAEAMTLSTRVAVFRNGEILQVETPENLYQSPANKFVANFLGEREPNFFSGTLMTEGDRWFFRTDAFTIDLNQPRGRQPESISNHVIEVGIRVEHVEVVSPERVGAIRGKVNLVEPMGSHSFLHVSCDGPISIVCKIPSEQKYSVGEAVGLRINKFHVFDRETEVCLMASSWA